MGLLVTEGGGGGDFTPVPAGVHMGVCYTVLDLGTHDNTYQGDTKRRHEVYVGWQIPALTVEIEKDGQKVVVPQTIGKFYTMSLFKQATLRKHLDAWRGKPFTKEELDGFELFNIGGVGCQMVVTNEQKADGSVKAKVEAVMPLPEGLAPPPLDGPVVTYSLQDGGDIPADVKDGLAKIIESSFEWQAMLRASGTMDTETGVTQADPPPPTAADMAAPIEEESLPF